MNIIITKRIGEYTEECNNTTGLFTGPMVLPCTEYVTKDTGDRPLYEALLMAAREVLPYMVPASGSVCEGEYTISDLVKEKNPPLKVDARRVPDELLHLRFIVGTSKYESGVRRLFAVLDGLRRIVRAGNRDKLLWKNCHLLSVNCQQTPEDILREIIRKRLAA